MPPPLANGYTQCGFDINPDGRALRAHQNDIDQRVIGFSRVVADKKTDISVPSGHQSSRISFNAETDPGLHFPLYLTKFAGADAVRFFEHFLIIWQAAISLSLSWQGLDTKQRYNRQVMTPAPRT